MNLGKATKVINKEWSSMWIPSLTRFNYYVLLLKHFCSYTPKIVMHKTLRKLVKRIFWISDICVLGETWTKKVVDNVGLIKHSWLWMESWYIIIMLIFFVYIIGEGLLSFECLTLMLLFLVYFSCYCNIWMFFCKWELCMTKVSNLLTWSW